MLEMNQKVEFKEDSWYNLFTRAGYKQHDKTANTYFAQQLFLSYQELSDIYGGEGLGRRIVNIPAKDMVREWFKIEGEPDGKVLSILDRLNAKKHFFEALAWHRLFGGGAILMLIDDGKELKEPVNEEQIREITALQVYDRWDISWISTELTEDAGDPNFGKPEIYRLNKLETGDFFEVHHSRLLIFEGLTMPIRLRRQNNMWGNSIIDLVIDRLSSLADGYKGATSLLSEFVLGIMKMDNLQSLIATKEGREKILARLDIIDKAKHILNTIIIDSKENMERISASGIGGMDDLIKRLELALCAASGIPYIKLFPEQTKGLGGDASGNIRMYYDDIAFDQEKDLQPNLRRLTNLIIKSKEFGNEKPETWSIKFFPLWQPTEKEDAETKKLIAETDQIYMAAGLPGEIVILNRFGGESYSSDIKLPEKFENDLIKMVDTMDIETEEEEPEETEETEETEDGE